MTIKKYQKFLAMFMALILMFSTVPTFAFLVTAQESRGTTDATRLNETSTNITNIHAESMSGIQPSVEAVDPIHVAEVPEGYTGIYTKEDLNAIRNNLSGKYILMNDIEFTKADFAEGGAFYNNGEGWDPIGHDETNAFTGSFEGNGFSIKGLYINLDTGDNSYAYVGLFGYISSAEIQNLGLVNSDIFTDNDPDAHAHVGSIAGFMENGIITDCFNTGKIYKTSTLPDSNPSFWPGNFIGGIVGKASNGTITNCYNKGTIYADAPVQSFTGGIVGGLEDNSKVSNCYNTGDIAANNGHCYFGGIAGRALDATISGCYNNGWITTQQTKNNRLGGITGSGGIVTDCYNTGDVYSHSASESSNSYVGGITGADATVTNCYNLGNVYAYASTRYNPNTGASTSAHVGGIGGTAKNINNCYNAGKVVAKCYLARIGGVAGRVSGTIKNCYNIAPVSASNCNTLYTGGITGDGSTDSTIINCYNLGAVTASSITSAHAGGISGYGDSKITNCYNVGDVSATTTDSSTKKYSYGGGIVGYARTATLSSCYNVGKVSAEAYSSSYAFAGGIAGYGSADSRIRNCYYLNNNSYGVKSDESEVGNSYTKCTASEMKKQTTFTGFDFDTVWVIHDNNNTFKYPQLKNNLHHETLSIEVTKKPNKLTYYEGDEAFDITGLVITAQFNTYSEIVTQYRVSGYDSSPGKKTITVEYNCQTVTFDVFVVATTTFGGGYGEEESPFLIKTTAHLNNVRNYPSSHFRLANDIVFTEADFAEGGAFYNDGKGWDPIATFSGTFDGNGFAIRNLYINVGTWNSGIRSGLFRLVTSGVVKNLGMVNSSLTIDSDRSSTIHYAGTIAGYLENSIITNCYNAGTVSMTVSSDTGTAFLSFYANVGGLIGGATDSTITKCFNTGNISGFVSATSSPKLYSNAGGIAGELTNCTLTNCYNTASISAEGEGSYAKYYIYSGGIAGKAADTIITYCYNIGAAKKGIVGSSPRTVDNCYYLDNVSDGGTIDCVKCTSEEMQKKETFVGFDFNTVWTIASNADYKYPQFRIEMTSIKVTSKPNKLTYYEGESFNTAGMVVAGYYSNGSSQEITDYTITGYDSSVGTKTIIVTYGNNTDSFEVEVIAKQLTSISVTTKPSKLTYLVGESFNKAGMVVTAYYSDNTTAVVTDYTVSGYSSTVGTKTITVTYGGKTATFTVTVTCEHKYSNWSSVNGTSHTRSCSLCPSKETKNHTFTNACDTTCDDCGYTRTVTHSYKTTWEKDSTQHWHECSVCGDKKDQSAHKYDNACDTSCNTCGYTRKTSHSYETTWEKDSAQHWHECSVCGNKKDQSSHKYDNACDTSCNTCGYTRKITHSYETTWEKDSSKHWHECSVCGTAGTKSNHVYDNDGDATCNTCGFTREVATEPETTVPETNAPETNAPETNAPETNAPETNAPETNAPETNAPETNAPETNAPETNAPETNAPETNAPETNAPETNAPQTNAPGTNAPGTNALETIAPETPVPGTIAPETSSNETASSGNNGGNGLNRTSVVIIAVGTAALGVVGGLLIGKKKK